MRSLIYKDGVTPGLAPAYDIVTTRLYIKNETNFALNLGGTKSWYDVNLNHFQSWARNADIPWQAIAPQLLDVLEKARTYWPNALKESPANEAHKILLTEHWRLLQNDFRL